MKPTSGLEYALFFGVPANKLELIDGISRWAFPFLSREGSNSRDADGWSISTWRSTAGGATNSCSGGPTTVHGTGVKRTSSFSCFPRLAAGNRFGDLGRLTC
ncbi:MAG: hypothetical protein HY000_23020 [Planctomycetes bacterium]|nr:hypothetical protein [Planctomycetota bacterium]